MAVMTPIFFADARDFRAWFEMHLAAKSGIYAHERSDVPALLDAERERFQRDAAAWDYFQAAPPGYRKTILHWITSAKREETRSKRLQQLMAACAAGKRLTWAFSLQPHMR